MSKIRYAFELSGEHGTLPRSEVLALLGIYCNDFEEICSLDQCLIVQASSLNTEALGRRLAMTHRLIELSFDCHADIESIEYAAGEMDLPEKSYRVRVRSVKQSWITGYEAEVAVGRALFHKGLKADLKRPEMELRGVITGGRLVLGREVVRIDRSSFEARRPHLKPFFHPGVLMPRTARAIVNLTAARDGEMVLDLFAGTGGILVEACLAGSRGIGVDAQANILRGARLNIAGMDCSLIAGDAARLPFQDGCVDAIVSDMPYGRSARIRARSLHDLLEKTLLEASRVLRRGRMMAMVADRPIGDALENAGFKVLQHHKDRIHRSLTRHIHLCVQ